MKARVFLNGKFVENSEAKISVFEPGFLLGLGVFETLRSYYGKIVYLDEHIKRLKDGAKFLGIKFPYRFNQIKNIIAQTVAINKISDALLRLTLWKAKHKSGILLTARRYWPHPASKYRAGFKATVSCLRQNEDPVFSRIKTAQRLLYTLSLDAAKKNGFDEALLLNSRGYITEATRSNLFLVKDNLLFTPALTCGCLDGITRRAVIDLAKKFKLKVYTGNFTLTDLTGADEAFLTNSLIGIMPLTGVDDKIIGKNQCGKITGLLIQKYRCLFA